MMYGGWGWGGGLLMALFGFAVIALIVWGIVRLTRHGGCCSSITTTSKQTPLDIARERYAKGEITKDQFEQIKKDLNQ